MKCDVTTLAAYKEHMQVAPAVVRQANMMTPFLSFVLPCPTRQHLSDEVAKIARHYGDLVEVLECRTDESLLDVLTHSKGQFLWFLETEFLPSLAGIGEFYGEVAHASVLDAYFGDALTCDQSGALSDYFFGASYDPVLRQDTGRMIGPVIVRRDSFLGFLKTIERSDNWATNSDAIQSYLDQLAPDKSASFAYPMGTYTAPIQWAKSEKNIELVDTPLLSIIIPSRNSLGLISKVLEGLFENTDYPHFEVLVVDNGSDDPAVLDLYRDYENRSSNFSAHIEEEPFNFASMINRGIRLAKGDHFLLLNNDIEVIEDHWLREMVHCLSFAQAGIVGAKLLFPDNSLQHAGVIVGLNGMASHWFINQASDTGGPNDRLYYRQSMTCVTGAVMLISRECYDAVGEWDEKNFAVAYNDVDYCMRARSAGFICIWTPHAALYHHESVSRSKMKSWRDWWRFQKEKWALKRIHKTKRFEDPAYSPRLVRRPKNIQLKDQVKPPYLRTWWD